MAAHSLGERLFLACWLVIPGGFAANAAEANHKDKAAPQSAAPPSIALKNGDKVVFFGDSITAWADAMRGRTPVGFIQQLRHELIKVRPNLKIELINAGVAGHGVADLQERVDRDVLARQPAVVVVFIGINDVWGEQGMSADEYGSRLAELVRRIRKAGAHVVLCTLTVIGEKKDAANPHDRRLDEFSEACRNVAAEYGVKLCDLRKVFIRYLAENNHRDLALGMLTEDGVHLNERGNRLVAGELAKALGLCEARQEEQPR